MACRRGRCVRWQAKSPYPPNDASGITRRPSTHSQPAYRCFTEIGVEILLDCSQADSSSCRRLNGQAKSLPPPCWLIAESSDAYAFTVQRPGDKCLSADDVEVQMERIAQCSLNLNDEGAGSHCPRQQPEHSQGAASNHRIPDSSGVFAFDDDSVQCTVTNLLTIFCERLVSNSSCSEAGRGTESPWDSIFQSGPWQQCQGRQFQNQDSFNEQTAASGRSDAFGTAAFESSCDCNLCSRTASGLPWKFGRRFSLPTDVVAERAVAAYANGALTVLVPRSRMLRPCWAPSPVIPSPSFSASTASSPTEDEDGWDGADSKGRRLREDKWLLQVTPIAQHCCSQAGLFSQHLQHNFFPETSNWFGQRSEAQVSEWHKPPSERENSFGSSTSGGFFSQQACTDDAMEWCV